MNHVMVAGHLGADPEVRFTSSGQKVITLRVACNSRKGGKEETIWWRLTIWGEQYDKMMPYLKKGSAIMAWGEMSKPEIYTNKEGQPQLSLNMTVSQMSFSPFGKSENRQGPPQSMGQSHSDPFAQPQQNQMAGSNAMQEPFSQVMQGQGMGDLPQNSTISDDDIPFL